MTWNTSDIHEWVVPDEGIDWKDEIFNNFYDVEDGDLKEKSKELQEEIVADLMDMDNDDLYLLLEIERELTRREE